MGRSAIFEAIFAAMQADPQLIPLLGPQTPRNVRLYRSFPQLQSFLATYEPQPSEGWLVLQEQATGLRAANIQFETQWDVLGLSFHVFATHYGLADDVTDLLDRTLHWSVFQQRDLQFGDYYVLFTRRFESLELYAQDVKLAQKTVQYRLELVLAEVAA